MTSLHSTPKSYLYLWWALSFLGISGCDLKLDATHPSIINQAPITEIATSKSAIQKANKNCEPSCDGSWLIDAQCNRGDCSVYGTTCIADPTPRCGTPECPRDGEAKVCLDEHLILSCRDGALIEEPGDCSAYGAWCSTAGVAETEARCVSALCFERDEIPYNREICSINQGYKLACYADSTIEEIPCPSGEICSIQGGTAQCRAPIDGCNGPSNDQETVDYTLCLSSSIGRCYNGNIIEEISCDVDESCYDGDGITRCLESACLNQTGELISGPSCKNETELIECNHTGSVSDVVRCAEDERCEGSPGQARCQPQEEGDDDESMGGVLSILEIETESEQDEMNRLSPETTYQDEGDESIQIRYGCTQSNTYLSYPLLFFVLIVFRLIFTRKYYNYSKYC